MGTTRNQHAAVACRFLLFVFPVHPRSLDKTDELDRYSGTGTRPRRLGRSRCLLRRLVHVVSGHRSRICRRKTAANHRLLTCHSLRVRFFFTASGVRCRFFYLVFFTDGVSTIAMRLRSYSTNVRCVRLPSLWPGIQRMFKR